MPRMELDYPLQYVKGVGPRRAEVLSRHGFDTVVDLLSYFPRHYLDRTNVVPIGKLKVDDSVTIIGSVKAHGILHGRRRRYEVILEDDTGAIALLWFHGLNYWVRLFKKDQVFAATGTVGYFMGYQMIHPDLERLDEGSDRMIHAGRIIPVYPQTSELTKVGLNSKGIRRVTSFILDNLTERIADPLPVNETRRLGLLERHEAISRIHFPDDRDQIERCRRRLAFDELLSFQFLVFQNKARKERTVKTHRYNAPGDKMKQFRARLPFEFTSGQKKVTNDIFADLKSETPMARLLQGDVGCGKTVVAVAAALYAAENGLQVAFMAPTEILAEQHYRTWGGLFNDLESPAGLLTSSLKPTQKKRTAAQCAEGEIRVLFGTHALIYDYVSFQKLGLVIIDEQHRFGVQQRGKLYAKGLHPDLLVMTATPIPRTLALTLYGDLDISTIDTMPPGRKPTRTVWRTHDTRDMVYQFVVDEAKKGEQAYVIYPIIEKSQLGNVESIEDGYKMLTAGPFRDLRVEMIHGRIKADRKEAILEKFRSGELDVLLSTTVVEVGIDNPNANIMVVEHAERFGLAQLHQLRGRIGRGIKQATMIALAHPPISDTGRRRLEYLASTNDGFSIAEADLELRGPGEMFGVKQSGLPELKAARLRSDRDLIEASRELLNRLFQDKGKLDIEYRSLYNYLVETTALKRANLSGG